VHSYTIINILLLGSPRLTNSTKILTNPHGYPQTQQAKHDIKILVFYPILGKKDNS
jgi:hypothetical protein